MAKKNYVTESRLSHDGVDYGVGEPVELDDKVGTPLVASGVLITEADFKARQKAAEQAAAAAEPPAE